MSIDETLSHGVQRETDDQDRALTFGVLSFALGMTGVIGGGTLANAFQYWAFEITRRDNSSGNLVQAMGTLPAILLGVVAVVLGLMAARSSYVPASATGKAGAVTGFLGIVGGLAWAASMLTSEIY